MACAEALHAGAHVISFFKPMNTAIKHWHIVSNREEMIAKAIEILQNKNTEYSSVLHYTMDDTVIKIMQLYGYAEAFEKSGN